MRNDASPRVYGAMIILFGLLLIGVNLNCLHRSGEFFAIAALGGPTATAYGLAILISPPEKWPPTKFKTIHAILTLVGFGVGVVHFLTLKFGNLRNIFSP